ncbi:HEPN domain-containing protein [Stigmatella aurantiaca]|uniref:Conserved uncharacterized protein n=1 Tax=Stigmatella aurantiaca (strain DW4/3-1) TaxID=378806 RepID=E3FEF5_STIAD|nr:HEPN domain-containing protein [Stigmatella aurantiaca]ADO73925.1 conserved uncharacterized protein [Stigmatella aurantiaca DW4/3-1]
MKNSRLRPQPRINKYLISSSARIFGIHDSDNLLISPAPPDLMNPQPGRRALAEGPTYRTYFFASFENAEPVETGENTLPPVPDFHWVGDLLAVSLAVFFGKRFEHHGLIETQGMFCMPSIVAREIVAHALPPFNSVPRADYGNDLNLTRLCEIAPLLDYCTGKAVPHTEGVDPQIKEAAIRAFFTAGRFYLRALHMIEEQPEAAYLDLVTVGEVLSNQYEYGDEEIFDAQTRDLLAKISDRLGAADARRIRERLRQIKRRYVLALKKLVSEDFFDVSDSKVEYGRLLKEEFEKTLSASYDLRSRYLHVGESFGLSVTYLQDEFVERAVAIAVTGSGDKDFEKILRRAPTLLGLERIMRRALLQFLNDRIWPLALRTPSPLPG